MSIAREHILEFLVEKARVDPSSIEDDTPLFTSSMLDSFVMVELILHLETTHGLRFPPEDITLDNFDTVGAILEYCQEKAQ